MPNWTDNKITISAPKEVLDKFIEDGKNEKTPDKFSFYSWRPIPETYLKYDTTNYPDGIGLEVGRPVGWEKSSPTVTEKLIEEYKAATKEQKEKHGVVGWYNWNLRNLGCKWNENFENVNRANDTTLEFTVTTPWSAPTEFLLFISQKYPEMDIECKSHYEDGYNTITVYNDGCECDGDTDGIQSEVFDYIFDRLDRNDEDYDEKVRCLHKFIEYGYWNICDDYDDNLASFLDSLDWFE